VLFSHLFLSRDLKTYPSNRSGVAKIIYDGEADDDDELDDPEDGDSYPVAPVARLRI
jgi:hypothetical protein